VHYLRRQHRRCSGVIKEVIAVHPASLPHPAYLR